MELNPHRKPCSYYYEQQQESKNTKGIQRVWALLMNSGFAGEILCVAYGKCGVSK